MRLQTSQRHDFVFAEKMGSYQTSPLPSPFGVRVEERKREGKQMSVRGYETERRREEDGFQPHLW